MLEGAKSLEYFESFLFLAKENPLFFICFLGGLLLWVIGLWKNQKSFMMRLG